MMNLLTRRIRNAGTEMVEGKVSAGSATLAMGYAAVRFTPSLLRALQGQRSISVRRPLGIFSDFEQQALQDMRAALNQDIVLGDQFLKQ